MKKVFLKISQYLHENSLCLNKVADTSNVIQKATLAQVFSCDFCEFFKNTFFHRAPTVAASVDTIQ